MPASHNDSLECANSLVLDGGGGVSACVKKGGERKMKV